MKTLAVYPTYFDKDSQKRKVRKDTCVSNPTAEEIKTAMESMKLTFNYEKEKRHPASPLLPGRFSVSLEPEHALSKRALLLSISAALLEKRNKTEALPKNKQQRKRT
ncbi:MAG: signal recognition particle Srp19 [Amphiamblys sp. WSBS2006]|nr:MAG: signal recognition particle Srp19 [Amphiamblys sp. WSBS2006]